MIHRRTLLVLLLALPACATPTPQASAPQAVDQNAEARRLEEEKAVAAQKEEARKKAEQEAAAKERAEADKKRQEVDASYAEFMKVNKCETKFWARYTFGQYFQEMADRNKITPWDVANGDPYTRRNISSLVREEVSENYINYIVYGMPKPIQEKFQQAEKKKDSSESNVFNASIKRDYECYKKLK